ncbi:hypothetical protein [Demequina sp. SO4-18]|uniref:hypothetical protein n=1 Tax=Demequina sp. SO4-18 TaxID=3401026 RepID=UPI003B5B0781
MRDIDTRIEAARDRLASAEKALAKAESRSRANTPGGLENYDSAILSGIRRKPNPKADARRFNAYAAEAQLSQVVVDERSTLERLERQKASEEADAASRSRLDLSEIRPGHAVRDKYGWHRVVKVNAKSVAVETGYSWTDRIAKDQIIEARALTDAP